MEYEVYAVRSKHPGRSIPLEVVYRTSCDEGSKRDVTERVQQRYPGCDVVICPAMKVVKHA